MQAYVLHSLCFCDVFNCNFLSFHFFNVMLIFIQRTEHSKLRASWFLVVPNCAASNFSNMSGLEYLHHHPIYHLSIHAQLISLATLILLILLFFLTFLAFCTIQ
ncbi:hypothetical protein ACOSP7_027850 [Xanthoceras sorbifolium]